MQTVKKVRFYLVWFLAFPFIVDYLWIKAIFTGEWDLIYMRLYQKFVLRKSEEMEKEILWQRVKILANSKK